MIDVQRAWRGFGGYSTCMEGSTDLCNSRCRIKSAKSSAAMATLHPPASRFPTGDGLGHDSLGTVNLSGVLCRKDADVRRMSSEATPARYLELDREDGATTSSIANRRGSTVLVAGAKLRHKAGPSIGLIY